MDTDLGITREALMYATLVAAGIGLILGIIPLVFSLKKSKLILGVLALILSTVAAAIGTIYYGGIILSLIVDAIFMWVILRKGHFSQPDLSTSTSDSTPE